MQQPVTVGVFAIAMFITSVASHGQTPELVEQLNGLRASPEASCGVETPVPPLRESQRLGRFPMGTEDMAQALREVNYQAAAVQFLGVTGPADAAMAFNALVPRYCDVLLDEAYSDIGVRHEGDTWQLVLAKPLLDQNLGDWARAGRAVLDHTNQARAQARSCGDAQFPAAPPLQWNDLLAEASLQHSRAMAAQNFFSHEGRDGRFANERVDDTGYEWQQVGENLAAGSGSAEDAVAGWIDSPEHCVNLMNPEFTEMGAAYATNPDSDVIIYWTQVFGRPR